MPSGLVTPSGGGLPPQWTVDSAGALTIVPANDNNSALEVHDADGHTLIQTFGGVGAGQVSLVDGGISALDATGKLSVFGGAQVGGGSYDDAVRLNVWARSTAGGGQTADLVNLRAADDTVRAGFTNVGDLFTRKQRSGALSTVSPSSGTAFQCSTTSDAFLVVPVTFNPTAGAAATCLTQVSPDNVTFSTVGTATEPAGIALDGTIHLITLLVPAAWRVKLTVTNATLGTGTYY